MRPKGGTRFDIEVIRALAGPKVFARGEDYFRGNQVQILDMETGRVLAQVIGSEPYRTELRDRANAIDGQCSCRAFEDFGFCKHMVAVALAANAAGNESGDGTAGGALSRIRDHLRTKSVDFLVEMIVQMAERDLRLFRKLELASAASQADGATLEARLGKAIDDATHTGDYVEYASARDWAAGVDEVLDAVEELVSDERAPIALKLAVQAIERIEQAFESIDDSDGDCSALMHRAEDIHFAAAAAHPQPPQFTRDLFAREMEDEYGVFSGCAARYADILGEEGLAEYRRLAEAAWQKCATRKRRSDEFSIEHDRLLRILDFFAERDGDIDLRIALRAKDLSSPYDYLKLAQLCLEHGRERDAMRFAEEGLWVFEDGQQDRRLIFFAADLLAKNGRPSDAEAHLWRAFEKAPTFELYGRLLEIGGETARKRALEVLERQCAQEGRRGWNGPSNLIVEIHLKEKAFNEAWESLSRFGGSSHLEQQLARATEQTHPARVIPIYEANVERLATRGGEAAYAEAAELIARLAQLRDKKAQVNYVLALKKRHFRKRNFMKVLE